MAGVFCPKCGATEGEFIAGFCRKCFLEDNKILELPKRIDIPLCKKCGKIRMKGKWLGQSDSSMKAVVESQLKLKGLLNPVVSVNLDPHDDGTTFANVSINGKIGNDNVSFSAETLLVPKEITCGDCTLLGANYYEAVLQIRFARKMKQQEFEGALREIDSLAVRLQKNDSLAKITSVERILNGFNVNIGSKRAAKKIVEHFERKHKAKTKSSFTLAGVDASGKEKKRFTFLVRI